MPAPLDGIRILDFSRIWAGPQATKLLADMGADVIKVESTRAWDPHRSIIGSGNLPDGEPGPDPWNRSGWFNTLHMSKYGITADISTARGKQVLQALVEISDVVIENFRTGAMERRRIRLRCPAKTSPRHNRGLHAGVWQYRPMEGLHTVRDRAGAARRDRLHERLFG